MNKEAIKMGDKLTFDDLLTKSDSAKVYQFQSSNTPKLSFEETVEIIKWGEEKERIKAIKDIKNYLIDKNLNKTAIEVLSRILESDPSDEARIEAVFSLWGIGDKSSFTILRHAMTNDPSEKVKARAIRTLGFLGDMESIPNFIYFLKLGRQIHALIRSAVISAFGSIFHTPALRYIIEATDDADINIRRDASRALGTYIANKTTEEMALNTLRKLCNRKKERDSSVRCFAIQSLRYSLSNEANEIVANVALNDSESSVRGEAISSLYVWQTELSVKTICKAFSDISWQNRKKAMLTLKRLLNKASGNSILEVSDALLKGLKLFPSNSREFGFTNSLLKK